MTVRYLALASLSACYYPTTAEPPSRHEPSPLAAPITIELSPEFTGEPVRVIELEAGVVVEMLVEGEGEQATEGKQVLFDYAAYFAESKDVIPTYGRRIRVGDAAGNPIHAALQLVIAGQRSGTRARVFLPAAFVDATKPARAPTLGDVWLTLTIEDVRDYPQIVGFDAFDGEPIATKVFDNGIEVHDHAPGHGPAAGPGDRIECVIITYSIHGATSRENPRAESALALPQDSGFLDLDEIIEGARVGMLRKYKGTLHGVEIVLYIQITWIAAK